MVTANDLEFTISVPANMDGAAGNESVPAHGLCQPLVFSFRSVAWMQFEHAVTVQSESKSTGRSYNIIMNKAAAYEAGFITSKEMPIIKEMDTPNPWKED